MKLGAYMIVRDEEVMLDACLSSLKGLDEIVILDTGSVDKTAEIASKHKCTYIPDVYKWVDDFVEARNKSLSYCTADWLIVIDADEVLKGDIKKIKSVCEKTNCNSFKIPTIAMKNGDNHPSVRLHKRLKKTKWHAVAHNYLSVTGDAVLELMEIHYGYSPAHAKDPDRTLRILAKYVEGNPKCRREKYYLAREFYYRKNYRLAISYWEYYLEDANFGGEIIDTWLYLARCHYFMGNPEKARDTVLQAIKLNGNFREAWRFLAVLSGPGNKARFNEIADTSSNKSVLFIRGK